MLKNSFYYSAILGLLLSSLSMVTSGADSDSNVQPDAIRAKRLFTSEYKGKISGFSIKMIRTLTQYTSGNYVFASEASNFFASIDEISKFVLSDDFVAVHQYDYKRSVAGKKARESITFDWNNKQAEYKRDERLSKVHPLTDGLLDPSLYQLFLQADAFMGSEKLEYNFIKRKRIEDYRFKRVADENVLIGDKQHKSVVLKLVDDSAEKSTNVWIIPDLDYQIGKILHITDGTTYSLTLTKYESDKPALQAFYKQLVKPAQPSKAPANEKAPNPVAS